MDRIYTETIIKNRTSINGNLSIIFYNNSLFTTVSTYDSYGR